MAQLIEEYGQDLPPGERFYFNRVFALVSSPWKVFLLAEIGEGVYRFGQLKKTFRMISRVTLTKYLSELERDGYINRKEYPAPPLRVEYSLSEMGKSVLPLLDQLIRWGRQQ